MKEALYSFHPRVFEHPYTPYYDAYKGHLFRIVRYSPEADDHVLLECVSYPQVKVDGYVDIDDILFVE
jgi:hypothetical protein